MNALATPVQNMRVDHCSLDILVAQDFLNRSYIITRHFPFDDDRLRRQLFRVNQKFLQLTR